MDLEKRIAELESLLADSRETIFLCRQDLERFQVENVAMKNFIQNLFESCQSLEQDTDLTLEQALDNLKENIRIFSRDHNIRLR